MLVQEKEYRTSWCKPERKKKQQQEEVAMLQATCRCKPFFKVIFPVNAKYKNVTVLTQSANATHNKCTNGQAGACSTF